MLFCSKSSSSTIVDHLETLFYRFGLVVARRPWTIIFISLFVTSICSVGLINLTFETDANKIWGPDTSVYISNNKWLNENFPQSQRLQTLIFQSKENGNILTPRSLKRMMKIHNEISKIGPHNVTFESICHR